tara:strand:- start:362 stop:1162 length:801 start_codon:yes stop_codon:yes gene_type:complete
MFSCETPIIYSVRGVVIEIDKLKNRLLIDHDEIPGFMDKMIMYFNVHKSINIDDFSPKDSVTFDLIINNENSYTKNFVLHGKSLINNDDFFISDDDKKYALKKAGEFIDDATFLTLDNKNINLSDFKNKFIVLSYIFSKCPMPNMCPAVILNNQYLADSFKNDDIIFLLISFDYIYDTPEILNQAYGYLSTDNLIFLSSYNHIKDIFTLTQQSGVGFWGVEENNIGHTMRTIIVDENLKVIKAFDGFDWKPGDAKKDIEYLIKHYK